MKKFWYEFNLSINDNPPPGTLIGVGITTCCKERSEMEISKKVFQGLLPEVIKIVEDINFENLDKNHVIPNMGDFDKEGIWFPLGYD